MTNRAHLTLISRSKNIGLARLTVATFASELDFTLNELEEIKVAISEAVTNCVIHAYPGKTGTIDIDMLIDNDQLSVNVTDQGIGIADIEMVLQPSYSSKEEHMGLGFAFIESFMDSFELESEVDRGTKVKMVKTPERIKTSSNQGG